MTRYINEIKVESVMDGRFSVTKAEIKKDKLRYTSESSLHNALSYAIAVLSMHFVASKELEPQIYDKLSNNAKSTIELAKKLHNTKKVRPMYPDQILGSDDTSLFIHKGTTKDKKREWKIIDSEGFK